MILVVGATGVLGSAIMKHKGTDAAPFRLEQDIFIRKRPSLYETVIFCAGTKGYAECEGNRVAFRADVDGTIRWATHSLRSGSFVVFVSTDGVEWGAHTAYARNRLLVEMALIMQPNVAIVRPSKFSAETVGPLADLCVKVGTERLEGLHYWGTR